MDDDVATNDRTSSGHHFAVSLSVSTLYDVAGSKIPYMMPYMRAASLDVRGRVRVRDWVRDGVRVGVRVGVRERFTVWVCQDVEV